MLAGKIKAFLQDQSGATAIEYGLLAMLTCLAMIVSFALVGNAVINLFDSGTPGTIANQTAKIN
ncbi:MAG TPA: Flp family type IVb pilin [Devosia sp.]|jgi:pilus assembly protein Flp/PilA